MSFRRAGLGRTVCSIVCNDDHRLARVHRPSPVITTIIVAVAAHAAVHRFDALALEYARTYEQLERLMLKRTDTRIDTMAEKADDDFVAAAEGVISIQNEAWMSRNLSLRSKDPGTETPPTLRAPRDRRDPFHRCSYPNLISGLSSGTVRINCVGN